jgi:cobaltochelatase CobS
MPNTYTKESRTALKAAITSADGWKAYRERLGVTSGGLTVAGLEQAAASLGIDVAPYTAENWQAASPAVADIELDIESDIELDIDESDIESDIEHPGDVDAVAREVLAGSVLDMSDRVRALAARAIDAESRAADAERRASNVITMPTPSRSTSSSTPSLPAPKVIEQKTRKEVFGITPAGNDHKVTIWDAIDAPLVDKNYIFDADVLGAVLAVFRRNNNVWIAGERGTGKTSFAQQVAARAVRPFARISFHRDTQAVELFGMTVPTPDGGTGWKDGALVAAMRRPGTIILLDEVTLAPPGMVGALQTILDEHRITLETGEVVKAADGVRFIIADNTFGSGDESGAYVGTNEMNKAFVDRATIGIEMPYLGKQKEISLLVARTGIEKAAADKLATYAGLTRQKGIDVAGLSPRRLIAWAEMIADGFGSARAFELSVINIADPGDLEIYHGLAAGEVSHDEIDAAQSGIASPVSSSAVDPSASAADQFDEIDLG